MLDLSFLSPGTRQGPGEGIVFNDIGEIGAALFSNSVTLHAKIESRRYNEVDAEGKPITRRVDPLQADDDRRSCTSSRGPFQNIVNRLLRKQRR